MAHVARILIADGESYYVEFKSAFQIGPEGRSPRDLKDVGKDIAEAVVAFANTDGGDLLVGVEDNGTPTGIPWTGDALLYLVQAPKNLVAEPGAAVQVHEIELDGQRALLFRVEEHPGEALVTVEGRCLWRKGAASLPVSPRQIGRRRADDRGDLRYEAVPVPGASLEDLDPGLMTKDGQAPHPDLLTTLRYWNLVEHRNGHVVLRRAALLLFAKDPLRWHANNRAKIRIVTSADEGFGRGLRTREKEILGPIAKLLAPTLRLLQRSLEVESRQQTLFSTSALLPRDSVEECVVNAIAHRNYAIEGNAVEIVQYPDRVEFRSPGGLPAPITIADLKAERGVHRSRNPVIMRVLRDLGWTRDQGEGMRRIFGAMRQVELHEPELEEAGDHFIVRLSTQSVYDAETQAWIASYGPFGLRPEERRYMVVLRRAGSSLSVDKLARHMGESYDETKRAIEKLEHKGFLWHRKGRRTYTLVEPGNVPHEKAFRVLSRLGDLSADRVIARGELQFLTLSPDQKSLSQLIDRWKLAGILTPARGKAFRLGPTFQHYLAQREGAP